MKDMKVERRRRTVGRKYGWGTLWRGRSEISMNKRQLAVRGVMAERSRWHTGLNKSAFMPQSWATCEVAVTKLEPTGLNWGRWQVLNGFSEMYLTPGKCPETSLEGPERGYSSWARAGPYAIFSTTIIQKHQPTLISAFYISRPVFYFVSALLSQPSGASVETNKSLQLANGSWSTSVVSARLEMTSVYVLRFISLSIKGELLIGPLPYWSIGFYSMLNS